MQKTIAIAAALTMALALPACTSKPQESTPTDDTSEATSVANEWTKVDTPQEAADGSDLGNFEMPADGTEVSIGPINWYGYQYTNLLAEADGAVGAAELTLRKGVKRPADPVSYDTNDVSGDYTEYKYTWDIDVDDWTVTCFGNEDGKAMKALWQSDNFSYSIVVRGQGDLYDTFGLGEEDTAAIVKAVL